MICRVEIYLNRATFVDLLRTEPKGLVRSNPPLGEYLYTLPSLRTICVLAPTCYTL